MSAKPTAKSKPKPKPKPDKEQSARFVDTARELEVDESGASFDRAIEKILPKPSNGCK